MSCVGDDLKKENTAIPRLSSCYHVPNKITPNKDVLDVETHDGAP